MNLQGEESLATMLSHDECDEVAGRIQRGPQLPAPWSPWPRDLLPWSGEGSVTTKGWRLP